MFIKESKKKAQKVKKSEIIIKNSIYILFLDIAKLADFLWQNADVSRTQGVCHVIYIFFGSSLGKV